METSQKALRYNQGKPRWSLVDFKALEPLVETLEYGAQKYDDHNWKKGLDSSEILESLSRHLFALMSGEEKDPESGVHHIGHIMANAMFYAHFNCNTPKPPAEPVVRSLDSAPSVSSRPSESPYNDRDVDGQDSEHTKSFPWRIQPDKGTPRPGDIRYWKQG